MSPEAPDRRPFAAPLRSPNTAAFKIEDALKLSGVVIRLTASIALGATTSRDRVSVAMVGRCKHFGLRRIALSRMF